MKVALLVSPKDFKDESVSKLKLMLEKWNINVVVTTYSARECVGYHGAVYRIDTDASTILPEDYDALILIDGKGVDTYKLYDFRPLLDMIKLFYIRGKIIGAIENSIKELSRANVISGVKISAPKDTETMRLVQLYHGSPSKNPVEFDKNLLTIGDNGNTLDFADALLEKLGVK
jgi:putative intracellular protease/amidase